MGDSKKEGRVAGDDLDRRLLLFRWTLALGLAAQLAVAPLLWTSDRGFPTVPLVAGLPPLPNPLCLTLTGLLMVGAVFVALPRWARFAPAVAALGGVLVLFDVNRLQPWFWQFMLLFLALGVSDKKASWRIIGFIFCATYLWSGIQKANLSFGVNVFPWLLHPLRLDSLKNLWPVAPVFEVAIGVCLAIPRTRMAGIAAAFAMHGFLLVALGPLGLDYNRAVWPWNAWMVFAAFVLFFRSRESIAPFPWRQPLPAALLLASGVLPALNLFGLWDDSLSGCLYSGKQREADLIIGEDLAGRLPADWVEAAEEKLVWRRLSVTQWALREIGVPPYPEPRVYRQIAAQVRAKGGPGDHLTLIVTGLPQARNSEPNFRVYRFDE